MQSGNLNWDHVCATAYEIPWNTLHICSLWILDAVQVCLNVQQHSVPLIACSHSTCLKKGKLDAREWSRTATQATPANLQEEPSLSQMVQRCEEFYETSFSILDLRLVPKHPKQSKTMRNLNLTLFFIAWKLTVSRNRKGEQWRSYMQNKQHVSRLSLKLPAWNQKIHQQPASSRFDFYTCHLRHKKSGNLSPSKKCRKNSHKDILQFRDSSLWLFFWDFLLAPQSNEVMKRNVIWRSGMMGYQEGNIRDWSPCEGKGTQEGHHPLQSGVRNWDN